MCSFGGWLALPVADYPATTITAGSFTVDVIGTALPSNLLVTKALVVPLVVFACLALTAPHLFRGFRFKAIDAAMAAFCLSPLLAYAAGKVPIASALAQAGYLAGVWGGTWMTGRLILRSQPGRRGLITAIAASGLVLVPAAILEGLHSPWFYSAAYGTHPFEFNGAARYFGFRPLAFFENGNQYGIWIAMAALAAVFRALRSRPQSWIDVAIAGLLVVCAIASQSVGAIILLVLGSGWLLASARIRRIAIIASGLLVAIGGTAYLSGKVPLRSWALSTPAGQTTAAVLRATGRESLGWRVQRDQTSLPMIYRAPLTGYGTWDWWRPLKSHPWGLPLLLAGQFGLLSLALVTIALLAGAIREMWQGSRSILPVVVILAATDAWLNSFVYFPAILAAAAMADPFWGLPHDTGHEGDGEETALAMIPQAGTVDGT